MCVCLYTWLFGSLFVHRRISKVVNNEEIIRYNGISIIGVLLAKVN